MPGKILPKAYWEKRADDLLEGYDRVAFEQHGELITICLMLETMDAELEAEKALQCGLAKHSEASSEGLIFAKMSKECRHEEVDASDVSQCLYCGRAPAKESQRLCQFDTCPPLRGGG